MERHYLLANKKRCKLFTNNDFYIYSFFYIVFIDYKDILDMINSILLIITGVSAIIIINTTMLLPEKIVRLISLLYVVIVVFALLELLPQNRVYLRGIPLDKQALRDLCICVFSLH